MEKSLFFEALPLSVRIGTKPSERAFPQKVLLSGECRLAKGPRHSDALSATVDYERLLNELRSCAEPTEFSLLERLADHIVDRLMEVFPGIDAVKITLWKDPAPVPFPVGRVGVTASDTRDSWSRKPETSL
ncbi:MAG: dihydroneopterin aldolase [Leptospirillia bacterium]